MERQVTSGCPCRQPASPPDNSEAQMVYSDYKSLYHSHIDGNLLRLGVRQSSRWHKGWIRGDAKWIPEVPQKTHLCAPTRDHRFGRTAFDQSNNSQSNVERTWKTLASAICTEISRTQLSQKLQKSLPYLQWWPHLCSWRWGYRACNLKPPKSWKVQFRNARF